MKSWVKQGENKALRYADRRDDSYIPYTDNGGNQLSADEILFTDEAELPGKQTFPLWGETKPAGQTYTIYSPGVTKIYDKLSRFPVALKTEDGRLLYIKLSAKTGEILPAQCGCCPVYSVSFVGAQSSGKTTYILQSTSHAFLNMLAKGTGCSIEDALPQEAPRRKRYEEERKNLMNRILPEPTRQGEEILPYIYYIRYMEKGVMRHALLKLIDIDGQECVQMSWDSKIFPNNYFLLCIGADEILAGEQGEEVQYGKMIDQLIPRLRVKRQDQDYELLVMITKSDCLDPEDPLLMDAFENSVELKDGKLVQRTHEEGFDYGAFQKRSACVRNYLKNRCPNFYNKLVNSSTGHRITFCMIASIGEQCVGNTFETWKPFAIDEPILSILTNAGMYPVKDFGEEPVQEDLKKSRGKKETGQTNPFYEPAAEGWWAKFMKCIRNSLSMEEDYEEGE